MKIGYDKPLYLMPFDHRSGFLKILNITGELTPEHTALVTSYKQIIYDGFKKALELGVPTQHAAILVDEQFGTPIIKDALAHGYTVCLTTEKSGQDEFDFEYGELFGKHIEKINPPIVKVLVRYNPGGDPDANERQRERLKRLSDYCHEHKRYFLFELLVPATTEQLDSVEANLERYESNLRPRLMVQAIAELQTAGIEADIWKIEGLASVEHYRRLVTQVRSDGRNKVGTIVLGRNAPIATVDEWLTEAAAVDGITGFAVGRTIFALPLEGFRDGTLTRDQAVDHIAQSYFHFYQVFTKHT